MIWANYAEQPIDRFQPERLQKVTERGVRAVSLKSRVARLAVRLPHRNPSGRIVRIEPSEGGRWIERHPSGGLTLHVPLEFGADPVAGLDAEQRDLIGPNDLKVVVVRRPGPKAPRETEVVSFNGRVVQVLSGVSIKDLYPRPGEIGYDGAPGNGE